jgi:hypothetical protein
MNISGPCNSETSRVIPFQFLRSLLPELKHHGHKVLLFSQWTSMLDILEWVLDELGLKYVRLDGRYILKIYHFLQCLLIHLRADLGQELSPFAPKWLFTDPKSIDAMTALR